MDDSEMTRLAAKAIGLSIEYSDPGAEWYPLNNGGDALGLVAILGLTLEFARGYAVCYAGSRCADQFTEMATMGYSIEEATRRAIVRAAASIAAAQAVAV